MPIGDCDKSIYYVDWQYTLRAGTPMPTDNPGTFKYHTFMAEKSKIHSYSYTKSLPSSSSFRGQYGQYVSANFSRLLDQTGDVFQGKIVFSPIYIDEDAIGHGDTDAGFIDCTTLSVSYNIMGIATVSFSVVSDQPGFHIKSAISAGGRTFSGYVTSATVSRIPNTTWYQTQVTLIATT